VVVYNDNGGNSDGQVMWESLISQGALVKDSTGDWVGAGGFVREWDSCSSTVSTLSPELYGHQANCVR
jgi:chitinase